MGLVKKKPAEAKTSDFEQSLFVKEVGEGFVTVTINGRDEKLETLESFDASGVKVKEINTLLVSIDAKGKRQAKELMKKSKVNTANVAEPKPVYKSNSAGQREGAIGHYASRITSSFVTAGIISTPDEAVAVFNQIKKGIEKDF